jgi:hypothetical protein
MLKQLLSLTFIMAIGAGMQAQISHGGQPIAFESPEMLEPAVFLELPRQNVEEYRAQDAVNDQFKDIPFRFGINIDVEIGMDQGTTQYLPDGTKVWRLGISSPGAVSINMVLSKFDIPAKARLFVYDAGLTHFIGSFNQENIQPNGGLALSLIQSDQVIIEYSESPKVAGSGDIVVGQITHGYRSILHKFEENLRGPFGNSGSCNINVSCPEGMGWEDQIRSVAVIVVGGNGLCTGSLVNNTAEDGTPYFLTANHCLGGNVGNWVFYFNHEASSCNGNSGPTNQSVSGAQLRASNGGSDVALLELNQAPPESFDVFFNGWDRSGVDPTATTCIHHPGGDIKKITHDFDGAYQDNAAGAAVWWIDQWEEGTTEPGSSGSPLYDQNGRVIGQLYGGVASCSNNSYDYYGRFDVSWDGNSASSRLRDWLNPLGLNPLVLDGFGGAPLVANDAATLGITGIDEVNCSVSQIEAQVTIRNSGFENLTSLDIEVNFNGALISTLNWTGNLATSETESVDLPLLIPVNGSNELVVTLLDPNGQPDGNPQNNGATTDFLVFVDAVEYEVSLVLDDYGSETTWQVADENGTVLYSGGPYGGGGGWGSDGTEGEIHEYDICLGNGCYTFTIADDFGDGMCCEYGEGSYTLLDDQGNSLASGGAFEDDESFDFCVTGLSVQDDAIDDLMTVFPNPASDVFTLALKGNSLEVMNWLLIDVAGRVVSEGSIPAGQTQQQISTSNLPAGLYFIQLRGGNDVATQRVVVTR